MGVPAMPNTMMARIPATMASLPATGATPNARQVQPAATKLIASIPKISAPKIQLRTIRIRKVAHVASRTVGCSVVGLVFILINNNTFIVYRQVLFFGGVSVVLSRGRPRRPDEHMIDTAPLEKPT